MNDHAHPIVLVALLCTALLAPMQARAQDTAAMPPEHQAMLAAWQKASTPGTQHAQLASQLVGRWTTRQTMWMDADAPPMVETGTAVMTSVMGGRQVRMDFTGTFMGMTMEGVGFSGYDNSSGQYTSLWMDNMSTAPLISNGAYDAASRTYTYVGQMPDMMKPGTLLPIRETLHVVDADHIVMEMFEPHAGKEVRTMQIEYTRTR